MKPVMLKHIKFSFLKALIFLLIFFLQAAIVVGQQVPKNSKSKEIIISEKNNFESDYSLEKLGSEVNFNINYNLMGATNSPENPNSYSESDSVYLNPATKTNYTFGGWFTDSLYTNSITFIPKGSTGDIELWAKFHDVYNITYHLDGAVNNPENPASYTDSSYWLASSSLIEDTRSPGIYSGTETSPLGIGGSDSCPNYPDGIHDLSFTVTEYVKLKSFDVWGQSWEGGCSYSGTADYTFTITGSTDITHIQSVNCLGKTTININAILAPGEYVLKANKKLRSSYSTERRNILDKVFITTTGKSMFGNLDFRYSNASYGNTTVIVPLGTATVEQFQTSFVSKDSTAAWVDDFVFTLKNSSDNVVGTPVTINVNSPDPFETSIITGNPSDWIMPADTYQISISSPSWAWICKKSQENNTIGGISFNGGQTSGIKVDYTIEVEEVVLDTIFLEPATKTNYIFQGWFTDPTYTNSITYILKDSTGDIDLWAKLIHKLQCVQKEAVRNGDFEAGYLPGSIIGTPISSHTYTSGGIFDFQSDLNYAGEWINGDSPCLWGLANKYGVGRVETTTNNCGAGNAIVYGRYTPANSYKDHTTGTDKGFSMFVDMNEFGGGFKKVWSQNVNVYGSEKYYFSSWFAQYGGEQAGPNLRFKVEAFDSLGTLIEIRTIGNAHVAPPAMQWQQFNGTYDTPPNAVTAVISIECNPTGLSSQDDLMIDDISFITYCKEVYNITYHLDGAINNPDNSQSYTELDSLTLYPATKTDYTFVGWFTDSTFMNPISEISTGTTGDIELWAKFDAQITYVTDLEKNIFYLYPNPANTQVVIGTDLSQPIGEVLITDMTGKIVKQFQTQKSTTEIDVSALENGIYFVKAGGVSQKLVKK